MTGGTYDVAIVGGGPAGTTVAAHLAAAGRAVLIVDAARFPRHKICGEYVPPSAVRVFSRLGVLDAVERLQPRRHVGMAVVAPGGTEVLGRYGEAGPRGFALRRFDLDWALLDNARRRGAAVLEGWRVTDLGRDDRGLHVLRLAPSPSPGEESSCGDRPRDGRAEPGRQVRCRALVGADGRNSLVARRLGLWRREARHRRWAVMGHFRGVDGPGDHGEMIVTDYGYCGINPLPDGLANVCVVVDPSRHGGRLPGRATLASWFDETVSSHPLTRTRMAGARREAGLWATGPIACRAAASVADGALLVGDAAGFYDPFTGEGIGMALSGGELAAAALERALGQGDLSRRALRPYEAERRAAFAPRLRLDRILQSLLLRPRLAGFVARRLRRDQDLADLLARVTGDAADAALVLHPAFLARLLLA